MTWLAIFYLAGSVTVQALPVRDLKHCKRAIAEIRKTLVVERSLCMERGDLIAIAKRVGR